MIKTIYWEDGRIKIVDQTLLPLEYKEITLETDEQVWEAIRRLRVRGAPAIGIAAAFGVAASANRYDGNSAAECLERVRKTSNYLSTSRPTAVNLFWALERMQKKAEQIADSSVEMMQQTLLSEANAILAEDLEMGRRLGEIGANLLQDGDSILTHCNAGGLATGGFGTALGVVYAAKEQGKRIHVYACETRPLLQGARLTCWELMQEGIEVTLICDNMAAVVLRRKGIHAVIVGADRIAANGDTANKVGTYGLACLAEKHAIDFYVAAPWSTIDLSLRDGHEIPIEMRNEDEVKFFASEVATAPSDVQVFNPAFDVTPARLITGIITDRGMLRPPFRLSLENSKSPR